MDFTTATQLIGSLGFPIVACIAMFVQSNKREEQHDEEVAKLVSVINENTASINKLAQAIEKGDIK